MCLADTARQDAELESDKTLHQLFKEIRLPHAEVWHLLYARMPVLFESDKMQNMQKGKSQKNLTYDPVKCINKWEQENNVPRNFFFPSERFDELTSLHPPRLLPRGIFNEVHPALSSSSPTPCVSPPSERLDELYKAF